MPFSKHAPSRRDIMKTGAAAALASTLASIKPAGAADDGPPREAPALSSGKSAVSGGKSRPFTTRPEIDGTFGVVATTHWIATAVAMGILERGGNAFDAGVAAAFTLQVVEPNLSGPGGDASVMVYDKRIGTPEVICGQGPAPAGATIDHYRGHLGLQIVPGTGLLAACVPGTFDTYMMILARHGTMRVRDVLEPAIGYARSGHPLADKTVATISTVKKMFLDYWPTSAALYLSGGEVPERGSLFCNPAYAETYARILTEAEAGGGGREAEIVRARRSWSQGFVAEAIDKFCRTHKAMDVSGQRHKGVLTAQDMATWKPTIEAPLALDYGEYTVLKPGPWTQGPVLLQMLALLKGYDLAKLSPTDPDFIHIWVECAKLAYADREAFYGDPLFAKVPMEILLSDAYNADRRALVGRDASMEQRPGRIDGYDGKVTITNLVDKSMTAGSGEPSVSKMGETRGDTVHIDVIDRDGNMFTATPSGGWLHGSPVIPELGWPLGTRAQMFWLDPGLPSSLEPGKRPRSTLTVGMALREGKPYLVWGTPGGDQQDQWNSQLFLRHVHFGMNLQESIDAPAWHIEHFPASFWPRAARPGALIVESRLPKATTDELVRRGHKVEVGGAWSEGRLTAASQDGAHRRAAANARGMQTYAAGR
jgi:gamma-glutamyltranspeptidase/glutathione hydrolase